MAIELEKLVIVILIMSAFVMGITTFTGDLFNNYPNAQNASFLINSGETATKISEMQTKLQSTAESTSIIDIMINGVWRMVTVIFDVLQIFVSLIDDMIGTNPILGIPAGFGTIFVAIITVMIVFGIAYLIMNLPR